MITLFISEILDRAGRRWRIGGVDGMAPTEDDVERVLDRAAVALYDEEIGTRFETGGLIVEKRKVGHHVYVLAGSYE